MKNTIYTLLLTSTLVGAQANYLNFVRQVMDTTPLTNYDIPNVAPSGTATAREPILTSSVFQLHTAHTITGISHLLDEKTVSAYHPTATITVTSLDPYQAIPRTRIDSEFTVSYTVSGIVTDDPDAQEAAKSVVFDHRIFAYAANAYTAPAGAPYTVHDHDPVTENGVFSEADIVSQLRHPFDNTTARGEEIFTIYANPDFGAEVASMLATARVHIWPVAICSFAGIDESVEYALPPVVTITGVDLYPESNTYIRYFKTSDPDNPNTSGICGNYNPGSATPDSPDPWITDLNKHIKEDGIYTIRLEHQTVFNTIDFGSAQLTVKRGIKINGNVNSSE